MRHRLEGISGSFQPLKLQEGCCAKIEQNSPPEMKLQQLIVGDGGVGECSGQVAVGGHDTSGPLGAAIITQRRLNPV